MISPFIWIIGSSIIVSVLSLVGVLTLAINDKLLDRILFVAVAFSAGTLLGGAFLHMIPDSLEHIESTKLFVYVLFGFILFFVMERVLRWRHCHKGVCDVHAFTYLTLIGDGLHNFIDGLMIAAAYVTSIPLGMVTTFMVVTHEIPQEIGDFAVLIYGGFSKLKALSYNMLTALTAIVGAILGYFLSTQTDNFTAMLLPFTAGGFIYIASSDLIPELHKEEDGKKSFVSLIFFLVGIGLMFGLKFLFE